MIIKFNTLGGPLSGKISLLRSCSRSLSTMGGSGPIWGSESDKLLNKISGMVPRNRGRSMVNIWIKFLTPLIRSWSGGHVRRIYLFSVEIADLYQRAGIKFTALYLKACLTYLQKTVAREQLRDCTALGPKVGRTRGGLPRIIPAHDRVYIRKNNRLIIRIWMTLFSLYRVLTWSVKIKPKHFDTIVDPIKGSLQILDLFKTFLIESFYPYLAQLTKSPLASAYKNNPSGGLLEVNPFMKSFKLQDLHIITKGSPNTSVGQVSTAPAAIRDAAATWMSSPFKSLKLALSSWCSAMGNWSIPDMRHGIVNLRHFPVSIELILKECAPYGDAGPSLGKLGLKEEPAGKIRVFAMVDCFTQWVMKPLHDAIFSCLEHIPQDGTFDQLRPVKSLLSKREGMSSLDLSSATDRLPVQLQEALLQPVLGTTMAFIWKYLLTSRDYRLPKGLKAKLREDSLQNPSLKEGTYSRYIRYGVGQPMGALSSWAMLALTHHAVIQFASYIVDLERNDQYRWFKNYSVLGDDVVISDPEVSKVYLVIMDSLGVKVNLAKSLYSDGRVCEFAKRFFIPQDCSPVPILESSSALSYLPAMVEFVSKYKMKPSMVLKMKGYGYKRMGGIYAPFKKLPTQVQVLFLALTNPRGAWPVPFEKWVRQTHLLKFSPGRPYFGLVFHDYLINKFSRKLEKIRTLQEFITFVQGGKFLQVSNVRDKQDGHSLEPTEWVPERSLVSYIYHPFGVRILEHIREYLVAYESLLTSGPNITLLHRKMVELDDLSQLIPLTIELAGRVALDLVVPKFSGIRLKVLALPFIRLPLQDQAEIYRPAGPIVIGKGFILYTGEYKRLPSSRYSLDAGSRYKF